MSARISGNILAYVAGSFFKRTAADAEQAWILQMFILESGMERGEVVAVA